MNLRKYEKNFLPPNKPSTNILNRMTYDEFYDLGHKIMSRHGNARNKEGERRFRELFGVSPYVVARVWNEIDPISVDSNIIPDYLLWALLFNIYIYD